MSSLFAIVVDMKIDNCQVSARRLTGRVRLYLTGRGHLYLTGRGHMYLGAVMTATRLAFDSMIVRIIQRLQGCSTRISPTVNLNFPSSCG